MSKELEMRTLILAAALVAAVSGALAGPSTETVSAKGQSLAAELDSMGVETKWIAGQRVDWRSGLPNGKPLTRPGRHTHCSAFVAAAAEKVGVYILRPPQHSAVLLANAQNAWLHEDGADQGWRELPDANAAQAAANDGELVVASYLSRRPDKPGHIAIVRPAARSAAEIAADGPLVIQAGTVNSAAISLREGFAGHPRALRGQGLGYFAHEIEPAAAPNVKT
jgi:hypothetical protein